MIRHIRGKITALTPTSAVIEVAGFGVEVFVNDLSGLSVGIEVLLPTYLAVKQDGLELYGFSTLPHRELFERLLTVPGVGTKTAMNVLRRSSREALEGALAKRDLPYLTKVVGLGKKSAEKMIIELADKIGPSLHDGADDEVFDTLVALGYTEREARRALQAIPKDVSGKDARLKAALSHAH